MRAATLFLKEIRIEHTLFALPFAYVGALFGAGGIPPWPALFWITVAVLGARTAAMAANRYLDRGIDARNPRTAKRALASGALPPSAMLWSAAAGIALLILAAAALNPLCLKLLPLAVSALILYPLCKRFTWLTHLVLGAIDGLAPLGAYIAVSGRVTISAWLLFGAVTLWVAGFDMMYALMDLRIDRAQGLHSLPARFGEGTAGLAGVGMHACMIVFLAAAGKFAGASLPYGLGLALAVTLMAYELRLVERCSDYVALNKRVFAANMGFSVAFLATTAAAFALPGS